MDPGLSDKELAKMFKLQKVDGGQNVNNNLIDWDQRLEVIKATVNHNNRMLRNMIPAFNGLIDQVHELHEEIDQLRATGGVTGSTGQTVIAPAAPGDNNGGLAWSAQATKIGTPRSTAECSTENVNRPAGNGGQQPVPRGAQQQPLPAGSQFFILMDPSGRGR